MKGNTPGGQTQLDGPQGSGMPSPDGQSPNAPPTPKPPASQHQGGPPQSGPGPAGSQQNGQPSGHSGTPQPGGPPGGHPGMMPPPPNSVSPPSAWGDMSPPSNAHHPSSGAAPQVSHNSYMPGYASMGWYAQNSLQPQPQHLLTWWHCFLWSKFYFSYKKLDIHPTCAWHCQIVPCTLFCIKAMYRNKVVTSTTNDRRYARCYDTETARHFHLEFIAGQFVSGVVECWQGYACAPRRVVWPRCKIESHLRFCTESLRNGQMKMLTMSTEEVCYDSATKQVGRSSTHGAAPASEKSPQWFPRLQSRQTRRHPHYEVDPQGLQIIWKLNLTGNHHRYLPKYMLVVKYWWHLGENTCKKYTIQYN